jgi:hypothetical protein
LRNSKNRPNLAQLNLNRLNLGSFCEFLGTRRSYQFNSFCVGFMDYNKPIIKYTLNFDLKGGGLILAAKVGKVSDTFLKNGKKSLFRNIKPQLNNYVTSKTFSFDTLEGAPYCTVHTVYHRVCPMVYT